MTPPLPAGAANKTKSVRSSRSKRASILTEATELFGRTGYDDAKWADVATAVGIGSTALYHYFESKQHCLYVIMADALEDTRTQYEQAMRAATDYRTGLVDALWSGFDHDDFGVLRLRVLVSKQELVGVPRNSPREEEARQMARERTRDLELTWATFLVRGMEQGIIPEAESQMLARAVLGLNTSVWHWYRRGGTVGLNDVADFFVRRQLAMIGLPMELVDEIRGGQDR